MLVDGAGNQEIAQALGISSKTVMHHTVAIYRKLGVRGRTEAATWRCAPARHPAAEGGSPGRLLMARRRRRCVLVLNSSSVAIVPARATSPCAEGATRPP